MTYDAHEWVFPDRPHLVDTIVTDLHRELSEALRQRGTAHLVVTGGGLGSDVCERLGELAASTMDDPLWDALHVWWGDERYRPLGDPERNDSSAALLLSAVSPEHVHRVAAPPGDVEAAARAYGAAIESSAPVASDGARFDVTLLGVGPDGHVASLFPGRVHDANIPAMAVTDSPKPPSERVTMTKSTLLESRAIWLMASGEDKAEAVAMLRDGDDVPATQMRGQSETLWWFDVAAAGDDED